MAALAIFDDFKGASLMDILAWRRVKAAGITFGSIFSVWFIYVFFGYTMTTFISRILTIIFIATAALRMTSQLTKFDTRDVTATLDGLYEKVRPYTMDAITAVVDLLTWKSFESSTKAVLLTFATAYVGNWMSDTTLFLLCLLSAFGLPVVYEKKKDEIDGVLAKAKTYTDKYLGILKTKSQELEQKVGSATKQD